MPLPYDLEFLEKSRRLAALHEFGSAEAVKLVKGTTTLGMVLGDVTTLVSRP